MSESEHIRIMQETLNTGLLKYGLFLVVMLSVVVFSVTQLVKRTKSSSKKAQRNLVAGIIGSIACMWLFFANLLPLWRDIQYKQIVEVHGNYYFDSKNVPHKIGLNPGHCTVTVAGKSFNLDLPAGWSKTAFPLGGFKGKIYYAKESRIILEFVPGQGD